MYEVQSFFDHAYASVARYWWKQSHVYSSSPDDHAPSLIAQQVLRLALGRTPGTAIDMGGGEGADAIRLALLGWEVEVVELSEVAVSKIRNFAAEAGVDLRVHHADVRNFESARTFDLVICNGVLHYIQDKASVCARMQAMTNPGGVNAVSLWSDYTPVPKCHRIVPTFPDRERGEVVRAYEGWAKSLLYFERARMEAGHDDMPAHAHSYIKMIATKP